LYDAAKAVGGYAGIFIVSVLGNAIPFISVPYLAVVYFYSMKIAEASPLLVGVVSGLGGAVGKLAVYAVGCCSRVFLKKETRDRYERIGKLLRSYGALAAFLFAVTPSPDDVIVIPLGLMKYDIFKLFLGLAAGKIVLSIATAYAGRTVATFAKHELLLELAASLVLFGIVIALLVFFDWEKILETIADRGFKGFVAELKEKGFAAVVKSRSAQPSQQ
jgi:membrane protein DedA with SNARE-associated domain